VTLNHVRRGAGPPLLRLHGIGSQHQAFGPVLDRLAAEHDTIAADLPGFGGSPLLPPGERPTADGLATGVERFLDEIGWERPHVAGNSLGGWVGLELAKRGRAASVCGLGTAGFWNDREVRVTVASLKNGRRMAQLIRDRATTVLKTGPARRVSFAVFAAKGERMTVDEAAESIRNLADCPGWDDTLAELSQSVFHGGAQVKVPVTMAWGRRERLLVPRERQARRSVARVPGARLVWLDRCGHVPMWDDPPQVADVILNATRG
jgi:pimeloyl-ACP methyl ester carboxylesterase